MLTIMNIFRQLRWKLTLSYTLVTVSALLVILLGMAVILFNQIFISENYLDPEGLIDAWLNNRIRSTYPMICQILSQSPVDLDLLNLYLGESASVITDSSLFRIGALQFSASTNASIRVLVIGTDGIIMGTSLLDDPAYRAMIGKQFDPSQVAGLKAPFEAAMAGDTNPKHLYTEIEANKRYVFAGPAFNRLSGKENQLVGVVVILFDAVPTQGDIPSHILKIAGRSLVIFFLGVGVMGAIFGSFFAHGLTKRFQRISAIADRWSLGDFSSYIDDPSGDEIAQFTLRLNNMAKQLQSLLRQRQDMAISEERNRLARDLHDSAKQQALAASLELGTALTLYERDPDGAKKHLAAADSLVDAVRKELTNLVDELRPQPVSRQDFSELLRDQALEWSQRSGIEMDFKIDGDGELPLATRETLFRITQEALANIARHSSANRAGVWLKYEPETVTLIIQDNGIGFDPYTQKDGVGLASMRERAEVSGGNFFIESTPGQGARITVTLPAGTREVNDG